MLVLTNFIIFKNLILIIVCIHLFHYQYKYKTNPTRPLDKKQTNKGTKSHTRALSAPPKTHHRGDEPSVVHPHGIEPLDDPLLDDVDAIPDEVDQQGVGRGLHRVRVPLLLELGLQEVPLVVLVHALVGLHGRSGPVDQAVWGRRRRWGGGD